MLNGLYFEKLFEAVDAEFASNARLLVTAERRKQVEGAAVNLDLSGTNLASNFERLFVRTSPHATRKRAQTDMARFIATPGRVLPVDGTFPLYETAAAHLSVEQGGKVGTVVVEPQK